MKDLVQLGLVIRAAREKENLTKWDLQTMTGIAHGYLGEVENGRVAPSPFFIFKLKSALPSLVDRSDLYSLAGIVVKKGGLDS